MAPNGFGESARDGQSLLARPAKDPGAASEEAIALARELGLSITVGDALFRRGHRVSESTQRFLNPRLSDLTPPDTMADREASAERIARAIRSGEKITVFGDYDCDGITSTAIMTGVLRALSANVTPLLATRRDGSYGLSLKALQRVFDTSPGLLITCDCGSSDHERLSTAKARGIDVIVIDHHLVPDAPLPAVAFLNPHRPECGFPYKGLASCGLALSLAAAIRRRLDTNLDLKPFLDLVAIGTIADVAPLTGDNRALVRAGLSVLATGSRPGLRAIAELAKLELSRGVTAEDVAFRIAPRLNAPGRLSDPDIVLEVLLEQNPVRAAALAGAIEQMTLERRMIQERMLVEAEAEIESRGYWREPALVLSREGWHPGIVGILAGRLCSRYGKPTIVIGLEGERGRGSVRGPSGARLYDALNQCRDALVGFGGHQAAAGVEVLAGNVDRLRDLFCASFQSVADFKSESEVEADVRLDFRDDLWAVVNDFARMEPCGEGNQLARVLLKGATVRSAKNVKGHLKLDVVLERMNLSAFAFQLGELSEHLSGAKADLIGRLRPDHYRGGAAVEMRLDRVSFG